MTFGFWRWEARPWRVRPCSASLIRLVWPGPATKFLFPGRASVRGSIDWFACAQAVFLNGEVLDYKLASQPATEPALLQQLQRYHQAVRAVQPDDDVRAAFVTADGHLVEIAFG